MNSINKKLAFPPSLHWVVLFGNTAPLNFIHDFGFRNKSIRILTSASIISPSDIREPVDCYSVEVITDLPKQFLKSLLVDLKKLAIENHCPVFCFSRYYEERRLPDIYTYLSYNEDIKGGYIWKSQGHHIGPYTLEPPPNAKEESLKESPSDPKPAETIIKISDLVKTCGFHQSSISVFNADALIRGDKTDIVCSASHNVQKGDWLVLSVESTLGIKPFHDIHEIVWEVTFVSYIRESNGDNGYGQVALSLRRIPNARFKKGMGGLDDCIVTTH